MSRNTRRGKIDMVKCPECGKRVEENEYDRDYDVCLYCLFPQSQYSRPADIEHDRGERNLTDIGYLLENLRDVPSNPRERILTKQDRKVLKIIKARRKD